MPQPVKICRVLLLLALFGVLSAPAYAKRVVAEKGWYDDRTPVPVMHLEGTIEEMAAQHGALIANLPNGRKTIDYFAHRISHVLETSPSLKGHPWLQAMARWAYRNFLRDVMIEHIPDPYRAAYERFANSAGVELEDVWNALVVPDVALRTVSLLYRKDLAPLLSPSFGCSSVIWNFNSVSVLHGRNLDYEGIGIWDKNQVILHLLPKEGLAHVAVASLGIHAPGITAFNEAGLTLAVHQLTFDDTQASGTPMPIISAEVIRNARTIDDAIAIIKGFPRAGGWAYVLSQGRDRAVVETSAHEVSIRRSSEPFFYQTNHVFSPALANHQIFYTPGSWIDSFERAETLRGWREKAQATPKELVRILSHRSRVAAGTIAKLDNVSSVILDAGHRRLWIAAGNAPGVAPNQGEYIEYRWTDLRSPEPPRVSAERIKAPTGPHPELRALLREAIATEATAARRSELLRTYFARTQEIAVDDAPPEASWAGLFLYVWHEMQNAEQNSKTAEKLLEAIDFALKDPALDDESMGAAHRTSVARLFRGRLLDLLKRRGEALAEYTVASRIAPFERVRKAAQAGTRKPYVWTQIRRISIDWAGVDLFAY